MSIGMGTLARIGHLYPSGGLCDFEVQLMAPEGVQFVTTRLPFRDTSLESDTKIIDNLEYHAGLLADAEVDLIALNCTAAGVVNGSEAITQRITDATGIAAVTTIDAVLSALEALSASSIALLTPYRQEVVLKEISFLRGHGIDVVDHASLPCQTPLEQAAIAPESWLHLAAGMAGSFDALLISCAGVHVSPVIETLENEVGVPVITSNAALLWHCLCRFGIVERPTRYGSLLAKTLAREPVLPDARATTLQEVSAAVSRAQCTI
ncbi:arylmalonate decarboxylase [Paraburkholderia caffeinilytica]|uniref:Maleate cis-trans isomerase n=1 Tax=Paraburkholderia caffeinilytica TaxID=1761016 RepID=A0ABQ1ML02_9BURK|nr:aspartate/glutamate racemase family protein [Paraburkholderia caffeinilytica]AXL50271.1 arylmalonate decarboxylase [Paraburkholderia caffeinilytica]GGC42259.1 maleate cis-trans isomerase [Paraburkholderia caffeinilytica]CAB3797421.1 Maleate isomerase [Paraburkholderia caffeinilytica]